MSKVAELIAELKAEGVEVAGGEFSIDQSKARERLEKNRFERREVYLVPVFEGLKGWTVARTIGH